MLTLADPQSDTLCEAPEGDKRKRRRLLACKW
jgi:hypothetical protein